MIADRGVWRIAAMRLWLPVLFIAAWQVLVQIGILNSVLFPAPLTLLRSAGTMLSTGELPRHFRISLIRLASGLAIGAALGSFYGLAMGASLRVRQSLEGPLSALYSTPKLALLPVVMLLVGVGEWAGILLIASTSFTMMAVHCLDAVRNLDRGYVDLARNYGAGNKELFFKVYLPGCMPQIFTGFRLSAGQALVMTISVEMIMASHGMGSLIWMAWQTFTPDRLYIAVFVVAGTGALLHYTLLYVEKLLIPWKSPA